MLMDSHLWVVLTPSHLKLLNWCVTGTLIRWVTGSHTKAVSQVCSELLVSLVMENSCSLHTWIKNGYWFCGQFICIALGTTCIFCIACFIIMWTSFLHCMPNMHRYNLHASKHLFCPQEKQLFHAREKTNHLEQDRQTGVDRQTSAWLWCSTMKGIMNYYARSCFCLRAEDDWLLKEECT